MDAILQCYRGACAEAAHPCGYNRTTHALYCLGCAKLINDHSLLVLGEPLFPLLQFERRVRGSTPGKYHPGAIVLPTKENKQLKGTT